MGNLKLVNSSNTLGDEDLVRVTPVTKLGRDPSNYYLLFLCLSSGGRFGIPHGTHLEQHGHARLGENKSAWEMHI